MGKKYGNRWEVIASLGEGGQANVFRVRDATGTLTGDFALKRLRNRERIDRFRTEAAAIERIEHPGVIKIIDRSSFGLDDSQHFIVMPLAEEGDLAKRRALYEGNLDGTICVVRNIAEALQAAHSKGVIHRDIKPANILFPKVSHDVWVSDFGISFVSDEKRLTPEGVVIGARGFTAPELEYGGSVKVSPAADVYSLGQLMFFLLSGGYTFARDNVFGENYDDYFRSGERKEIVRILLSKMVVGLEGRLSNMSEVIAELERLSKSEVQARTVLISAGAQNRLAKATEERYRRVRAQAEAENIAATAGKVRDSIASEIGNWLQAECTNLAAALTNAAEIPFKAESVRSAFEVIVNDKMRLRAKKGYIIKEVPKERYSPFRGLAFFICERASATVGVITLRSVASDNHSSDFVNPLAVFPVIWEESYNPTVFYMNSERIAPLAHEQGVYRIRKVSEHPPPRAIAGLMKRVQVHMLEFEATDWLQMSAASKNSFARRLISSPNI